MAETVGQHSVAAFTSPVNGTTPIDANTVRGNDNTVRSAYVDHDADPGIHVQSSSYASRPVAGTAGRKWITFNSGRYQLWYDDGSRWHEVASDAVNVDCLADTALNKGDVVKITGFNNGQNLPTVAKVASASDTAFGIVENTVAINTLVQIINTGIIEDVDTNGYAVGTILYPNTSGGFTSTKPTSGSYQPAGYVLRGNTNNGVLFVEFSAPRIVERSDNTASTIVLRDASGNFSAGTITAGALTSTGLVTFASLKGTGATTVTNILDEDNMASDSATALATQQSIKAYVDAKVATVDTLAEVLANGNTTGANDIIVNAGQKIRTPLIASQNNATAITIADTTGALTFASALADSNLATISTAGKVANSATTATSANTASAIVARDASGNFTAGTITATLSGAAPAGSLSGTTLASNVVSSSLTSVGTLTSLTVSGAASIATGVASQLAVFGANNTTDKYITVKNSGGDLYLGSSATGTYLWNVANTPLQFFTNNASRMTLDASGNLGLGVTPSAWGTASSSRAQQIGTSLSFLSFGAAGQGAHVGGNTWWDGTNWKYLNSTGALRYELDNAGSSHKWHVAASGTAGNNITFTQAMMLDASGNLGLGVTPSAWDGGSYAFQMRGGALFDFSTTDTAYGNNVYYATGSYRYRGTGSATYYQQTAGSHAWFRAGSGSANAAITFTQAMTLDASGNLGLGVTPSAWLWPNGSAGAFQLQSGGAVSAYNAGTYVSQNWYYNAAERYIANGFATRYDQANGQHIWRTAANNTSGAGAALTFSTQMTLDASGNLGVGATSLGSYRLSLEGSNLAGGVGVRMKDTGPSGREYAIRSDAGAFIISDNTVPTERARITSGGNFELNSGKYVFNNNAPSALVVNSIEQNNGGGETFIAYSTGAGATRFYVGWGGTIYATNTTISAISDARLKENIRDLDVGLDAILALKPRKFDWKEGKGTNQKDVRGFIAQEFEQVFPDLIDQWKDPAPEGEEPYRSVRPDLIPVLVKAIQELDAKNKALEARLEALEA